MNIHFKGKASILFDFFLFLCFYTDFIFCISSINFTVVPFVMMKEVCCVGVTANPRSDMYKSCVVACKRNHLDFWNSCKPLQNIVNVESLYATMVLYFARTKEPSHLENTF